GTFGPGGHGGPGTPGGLPATDANGNPLPPGTSLENVQPGPDGKAVIHDGNTTITVSQPDGPNGPATVTVDDGSGKPPVTYTMEGGHGAGTPGGPGQVPGVPGPGVTPPVGDMHIMPAEVPGPDVHTMSDPAGGNGPGGHGAGVPGSVPAPDHGVP